MALYRRPLPLKLKVLLLNLNIQQNRHQHKVRRQRADAIAQERQRYTGYRHNTCGHTNVDHNMEHKHRRYTGCQKHAEGIIRIKRNRNTAPNNNHIHADDKHRSDKAKLFTGNSKYKVRMVFRQKVQLALRSGQPAFAKEAAAADSNFD